MIFRRGRWQDDEGAVLVEFAIAFPILLLIVWCIVDFARAYYTVNSLATAVREGARYAAVQIAPGAGATVDSTKNHVTIAFNAFGGPPIVPDSIHVLDESATNGSVTVSVGYVWTTTTPINFITGGAIHMTRRSTFRWERAPTS